MKCLSFTAFLAALLLPTGFAVAQETIFTNRATELRAEPSDSAVVIKALPDKSPVQQLQRSGAWSKVKSDTQIGWVRMMHLRGGAVLVQPESGGGSSFFSGAAKLLGGSGNSTTKAQNASLGIRGLSKEDLQLAEPDAVALEKMQGYKAKKDDAERFAKEAKLIRTSVDYGEMDASVKPVKGGKK